MDKRKGLAAGEKLIFLGKECIIEGEIGRGSNAIVYKGKYPDSLNTHEWHTVLIKELFPFHPRNAIYRDQNGSIICEKSGEAVWEEHLHSFETGNRVHLRMLNSFPSETGANIDSFFLHNTWYSILGYTGGRSLLEDQQHGVLPLRHLVVRLLHLLDSLACFHEEGYLHLDISPDNILLLGSGNRERVMLIDYNSVHNIQTTGDNSNAFSIKTGYTAPEIRTGNLSAVSCASDIYSVASVFYQSLTGSVLTSFQMTRPTPPDISDAPPVKGQPDTVLNMVKQILARGLAVLPRRRYQTIDEMRLDAEELIDRIDGIGITHCALWEAGRRAVLRTVRNNPAFSYLLDEDELFSVSIQRSSGEIQSASDCLSSLKEPNGHNMLLIGEGGSGKTSTLLRFMLASQERYSPYQPAVFYLSLYGRKNAGARLIDFILENMHFKVETGSFTEARQMLLRLLDTPLQAPNGELPTLVLLLDGLNEYAGSKDDVVEDLQVLSKLKGIRLLVSSRSLEALIPVETVNLIGLQGEEVTRVLTLKGLAVPDLPGLYNLLQNSLMLSIFLRSAEATNSQLLISGQDELLDIYYSSLLDKELQQLHDDSDDRWLMEAAVRFVLPAIAGEAKRKNHPLSDTELLPVIKRLFALTKKRSLFSLFPSWVGHSSAIRGGVSNAEEWYGLIVHRILWKRLALLIRSETDTYQLPHQIFTDYLAEKDRRASKKLRRRHAVHNLSIVVISFSLLGFGIWGLIHNKESSEPIPYNQEVTSEILTIGNSAYQHASQRIEAFSSLVDASYSPKQFSNALHHYIALEKFITSNSLEQYYYELYRELDDEQDIADYHPTEKQIMGTISLLLKSGDIFKDSGGPLDLEAYLALIELDNGLSNDYAPLIEALSLLVNDIQLDTSYGEEYRTMLSALINQDTAISNAYYTLAITSNTTEAKNISGRQAAQSKRIILLERQRSALYTDVKTLANQIKKASVMH